MVFFFLTSKKKRKRIVNTYSSGDLRTRVKNLAIIISKTSFNEHLRRNDVRNRSNGLVHDLICMPHEGEGTLEKQLKRSLIVYIFFTLFSVASQNS